MKDKISLYLKLIGAGLILLLLILNIVAIAAMPQWFLILTIVACGLLVITGIVYYVVSKKLKG